MCRLPKICLRDLNPRPLGSSERSTAGKVTAGMAEGNGSLLPCGWLQVTCGLTACTSGSAPGPTLGNEYGRTLPFNHETFLYTKYK